MIRYKVVKNSAMEVIELVFPLYSLGFEIDLKSMSLNMLIYYVTMTIQGVFSIAYICQAKLEFLDQGNMYQHFWLQTSLLSLL